MKYIAMLSGGRDSTAMVFKLLEEKRPLDYIIFTDTEKVYPFENFLKEILFETEAPIACECG